MGTEYYAVNHQHQEIFELGKRDMSSLKEDNSKFVAWIRKRELCIDIVNDATGDMIPYHNYVLVGSLYCNQSHRIGKLFHKLWK